MACRFRTIYRTAPAAALFVWLGCVAATPAFAGDDGQGNFFSSVLQMIGVDIGVENDSGPPIDYHQRPPLVVPPTMTLPKPRPPLTSRARGWPQDPDALAAKKAAALAKAPRVDRNDGDYDPAIAAAESRRRGAPHSRASAKSHIPTGNCLEKQTCSPKAFWSMLRNTKRREDSTAALVPGQAPPREYLTQPPSRYMIPTKVVKETAAAPQQRGDDIDNSVAYFRKQQQE